MLFSCFCYKLPSIFVHVSDSFVFHIKNCQERRERVEKTTRFAKPMGKDKKQLDLSVFLQKQGRFLNQCMYDIYLHLFNSTVRVCILFI